MAASTMSTQPPPITAALPLGPGLGASTAKLRAGAIPAPSHPDPAADQPSVFGIGAAGGHDRPIPLLLLQLGARAGLAGAGTHLTVAVERLRQKRSYWLERIASSEGDTCSIRSCWKL
jgi:hypothetical protein